jgi:DNA repair photolyase
MPAPVHLLLRRDLALLAEASEHVPVDMGMSIAIYDDELQQSVEPGTPTTKARLATVTAVRDAGPDCAAFLMPILPSLTDMPDHRERAVAQVKAAGGSSITHWALHVKPGTKEWYFWWLAAQLSPIIRRPGLERTPLDPATGIVGSRAQLRICYTGAERLLIAEEMPPELALRAMPQPMLF